jgi:hypothetical protein
MPPRRGAPCTSILVARAGLLCKRLKRLRRARRRRRVLAADVARAPGAALDLHALVAGTVDAHEAATGRPGLLPGSLNRGRDRAGAHLEHSPIAQPPAAREPLLEALKLCALLARPPLGLSSGHIWDRNLEPAGRGGEAGAGSRRLGGGEEAERVGEPGAVCGAHVGDAG